MTIRLFNDEVIKFLQQCSKEETDIITNDVINRIVKNEEWTQCGKEYVGKKVKLYDNVYHYAEDIVRILWDFFPDMHMPQSVRDYVMRANLGDCFTFHDIVAKNWSNIQNELLASIAILLNEYTTHPLWAETADQYGVVRIIADAFYAATRYANEDMYKEQFVFTYVQPPIADNGVIRFIFYNFPDSKMLKDEIASELLFQCLNHNGIDAHTIRELVCDFDRYAINEVPASMNNGCSIKLQEITDSKDSTDDSCVLSLIEILHAYTNKEMLKRLTLPQLKHLWALNDAFRRFMELKYGRYGYCRIYLYNPILQEYSVGHSSHALVFVSIAEEDVLVGIANDTSPAELQNVIVDWLSKFNNGFSMKREQVYKSNGEETESSVTFTIATNNGTCDDCEFRYIPESAFANIAVNRSNLYKHSHTVLIDVDYISERYRIVAKS